MDGVTRASEPSGTETPLRPVMCSRSSAARSRWYCGSSSITTQYWSLGVKIVPTCLAPYASYSALSIVFASMPSDGGAVAIDADLDLRVLDLQVARDVGDAFHLVKLLLHRAAPPDTVLRCRSSAA